AAVVAGVTIVGTSKTWPPSARTQGPLRVWKSGSAARAGTASIHAMTRSRPAVRRLDRATLLIEASCSRPAVSRGSVPARITGEHGHELAVDLEHARTDRRHLALAQRLDHAGGRRTGRGDQLQVLDGGRAQADLLPLGGGDGVSGGEPLEIHDLVAIHHRLLLGRHEPDEEARVEADGLLLGRDPVGKIGHEVGGQGKALGPQHVEERGVGLLAGRAIGLVALTRVGRDAKELPVALVGEEDAYLLEGLADGPDPIRKRLAGREPTPQPRTRLLGSEAPAEALAVGRHVICLDLASREHVVTRCELALGVALEEQRLHGGRRVVAAEHMRGGGRGRHGRGHADDCHTGDWRVSKRVLLSWCPMTRSLGLLALLILCFALSASASTDPQPARADSQGRTRCLNDRNETGNSRPLFFVFCAESP